MTFNKISMIISIVLFSYSLLLLLFLWGVRIRNKIIAKKVIDEESKKVKIIEVEKYENQKADN